MVAASGEILLQKPVGRLDGLLEFARRNPTVVIGTSILSIMGFVAVFAPLLASDPLLLEPVNRLKPPSGQYWFGTDHLGRDVFARTVFGTRISLAVGLAVAFFSTGIGLAIGLVAGYIRIVDAVVMRIMDGLMAIPGILFAIALMALFGSSVENVILAITVPEIPRVVRLVRAVVLTIREQQGPRSPVAAPRHSHRGKERRKSGDYRPSATPHCGPWLQRALPSTPGRPAGGRANAQAAIEAPASGQRGPRVRFSGLQATTPPHPRRLGHTRPPCALFGRRPPVDASRIGGLICKPKIREKRNFEFERQLLEVKRLFPSGGPNSRS